MKQVYFLKFKRTFAILPFSIFGLGGCLFAQIPTTNLVAFYPFNGNTNDISGNGNHGIVYGATLTTDRCNVPNSAYFFNGNSYIKVPHSSSLNSHTNALSISLWVYSTNPEAALVCKSSWGMLDIDYRAFIYGTSRISSIYDGKMVEPFFTNIQNQWIHYVFIYHNGIFKAYQNATLISQQTGVISAYPLNYSTDLYIGVDPHGGIEYLNGKIDDIYIYDRVLTDNEIFCLYTQACPRVDTIKTCNASVILPNGEVCPVNSTVSTLFTNTSLCDSIITWRVESFTDSLYTQLTAHTCQNEPYSANGFNIPVNNTTATGSFHFYQNLTSSTGCDSIVELILTIHPVYHVQFTGSICRNQTYTANGFNIPADSIGTSGTFHFRKSLTSTYGCDSIVELTLTVYPIYYTLYHASVCQNQLYIENGFNLSADNTANAGVFRFQQRLHSIHSCDSIIELELTVFQEYYQFTASTCQKEPYIGYGFNLSPDSTAAVGVFHFYQNLTSSRGCDSIVDLELIVHPAYTTEINAQSCNYYEINDTIYTESGNYVKTLNTVTGCDSVIKLYLTVFNEYNTKITVTTCQSFLWNGQTYTTSGEYEEHFVSMQGCDSTVYLDLTILPVSSIILEDTVYMYELYDQYGFTIPPQENKGIYTFQQTLQNQWGCDSTVKLILHVLPQVLDRTVELTFPNAFTPNESTNNYFSIVHKRNIKDLKIQIYNRWGERVFQNSDIDFKWDGKDLKGNPVPIGSYIYLVEYHLQTDPNIVRQKTGSVNVMR